MKRRVLAIIYSTVTIASLLLLSVQTANYLQFYGALVLIQAAPEGQQVTNDLHTNITTILLHLRVSNPSGYSGLKIQWVYLGLHFVRNNSSFFESLNLRSPNPINAPVGPGGVVRINATFQIQGTDSRAFADFYSRYRGDAMAYYSVDIHLATWLQAFAGIDIIRDFQYPLQ